jgi:hypothetical protein
MTRSKNFCVDVTIGVASAMLGAPTALLAYMVIANAALRHMPTCDEFDLEPFAWAVTFGLLVGVALVPIVRACTGAIYNRQLWAFGFFLLTAISFPIIVLADIAHNAF